LLYPFSPPANLIAGITLLLGIVLLIDACKKDEKSQYSYWQVNDDKFSTNDVTRRIGGKESSLRANNASNNFSLSFAGSGWFPPPDSCPVLCGMAVQNWACLVFTYNDIMYYSGRREAWLIASSVDGNASYSLKPTWFYNTSLADSVLVQGVFNEP
jgi:hypothetical protein